MAATVVVELGEISCNIIPISVEEYPLPAPRPLTIAYWIQMILYGRFL